MFTFSSTLIWAVLTGPADWVCHIGTVTLCIEAVAYSCIIVTWWSGAGGIQASSARPTGFLQCFDTVDLVIWLVKVVHDMIYNVFGGTLNLAQSITQNNEPLTGGIGLHSGWQCVFLTWRRRLVRMEKLQLHCVQGNLFMRSSTNCSAPVHAFNTLKPSAKDIPWCSSLSANSWCKVQTYISRTENHEFSPQKKNASVTSIGKNKGGYSLQAVWTRRRGRVPWARGPRRRRGWGVGGGVPSPVREVSEEGMCPCLENFVAFGSQNGEFWCILGRIFTV